MRVPLPDSVVTTLLISVSADRVKDPTALLYIALPVCPFCPVMFQYAIRYRTFMEYGLLSYPVGITLETSNLFFTYPKPLQ